MKEIKGCVFCRVPVVSVVLLSVLCLFRLQPRCVLVREDAWRAEQPFITAVIHTEHTEWLSAAQCFSLPNPQGESV